MHRCGRRWLPPADVPPPNGSGHPIAQDLEAVPVCVQLGEVRGLPGDVGREPCRVANPSGKIPWPFIGSEQGTIMLHLSQTDQL